MKKILTALLALAMLLGCVAVFASCGNQGTKPNLDLEEAAEALEDEDYNVTYSDDEDDLSVGVVEQLYASNGDDYLRVVKYASAATAKIAYEELKLQMETEIEYMELEIKRIEHILKKYDDDLDSDEVDDYEDDLKDLEKELKKTKKDYCYGISGKYVWAGTSDAAKDSEQMITVPHTSSTESVDK